MTTFGHHGWGRSSRWDVICLGEPVGRGPRKLSEIVGHNGSHYVSHLLVWWCIHRHQGNPILVSKLVQIFRLQHNPSDQLSIHYALYHWEWSWCIGNYDLHITEICKWTNLAIGWIISFHPTDFAFPRPTTISSFFPRIKVPRNRYECWRR